MITKKGDGARKGADGREPTNKSYHSLIYPCYCILNYTTYPLCPLFIINSYISYPKVIHRIPHLSIIFSITSHYQIIIHHFAYTLSKLIVPYISSSIGYTLYPSPPLIHTLYFNLPIHYAIPCLQVIYPYIIHCIPHFPIIINCLL